MNITRTETLRNIRAPSEIKTNNPHYKYGPTGPIFPCFFSGGERFNNARTRALTLSDALFEQK